MTLRSPDRPSPRLSKADIDYLQKCLAVGLQIFYANSTANWQRVTTMGFVPDEKGKVVFLDMGDSAPSPRSRYVVLCEATYDQFLVIANLTKWP